MNCDKFILSFFIPFYQNYLQYVFASLDEVDITSNGGKSISATYRSHAGHKARSRTGWSFAPPARRLTFLSNFFNIKKSIIKYGRIKMFSRIVRRIPQTRRFTSLGIDKNETPELYKYFQIYKIGFAGSACFLSYAYFEKNIMTEDLFRPFTGFLESVFLGTFVSIGWPIVTPIVIAKKLDKLYQENFYTKKKIENNK